MEQLDRSSSLGTRLKLYVTDVAEVSALPSGVRKRWGAWEQVVAGKSKAERAQALREANYYGTGDVEDVEMLAVVPGMLELRRQKRQLLLQERMLVAHYRRNLRLADIQLRAAQRAARAAAARAEEGSPSAAPAAAGGAAAGAAPSVEATQRILQQLAARKGQHAAALGALEQQQKLVLQRLAEANEAEAAERAAALAHLRGRMTRGAAGRRSSSRSRSPAGRSSNAASTQGVARSLFGVKTPSSSAGSRDASGSSMGVGGSPRWAARHAALRRDWGSRRMARAWRAFAAQRKTTHQLVVNFVKCGISGMRLDGSGGMTDAAPPQLSAPPHAAPAAAGGPVMIGGMGGGSGHQHMAFEEFAGKLQSPATLRATQLLLRRLEQRLEARGVSAAGAQRLLRQLLPGAPPGAVLARYPVRVFLCAFMVVEYPQVVFSNVGDVEAQLSGRATAMLAAFDALLAKLLAPLPPTPGATSPGGPASPEREGDAPAGVCPSPLTKGVSAYRAAQAAAAGGSPSAPAPASAGAATLGQLLVAWDDAWMEYLDQFAVWKGRDASGLEAELIRMAAQLERSLLLKLRGDGEDSARVRSNPDLQALIAQVRHDTALLRERVGRLTGAAGRERLAAALEAVRAQVEADLEEMGSDASWDSESVGSRSRPSSRLGSRSPSLAAGLPDMAPSDATPSPTAAPGLLAAAARERNSPPPSPPRSPPSDAGRGGESEAGAEGAGLGPSNQQMVWEMLYDPTYSLSTTEAVAAWQRASALAMGSPPPAGEGEDEAGEVDMESLSPEALTALLTRRAHMIAERAFWDSIAWRLQTGIQGGGLPQQLGPLLSELGLELGELLGDSLEGEALTQQFGERALMGRLTSRTGQQGGGANLTAVAGLLEQLMKALVPLGGAAHGNQVAEAAGAVQQQLVGALAAFADGGAADNTPSQAAGPLAEALTKALRLLMTQLKLVKLEAANTRLAALASAMKERGAVVYLRTKLAKEWGLPTGDQEGEGLTREVVGDKLPKTAAWVAEVAANKLPQVQQAMTAAGLLLPRDQAAAAVAAAAAATPVQLRAGLRSPTGSAPPRSPGSAPPSPGSSNGTASGGVGSTGLPVVYPADLDGWRGVTRLGLVSLVTGDAPAVGPALPELLQYDKERLHKAQNDLQQLLVLAGSLLIVQQLRAAAGRGWDAEGRAAARRRLMVVLADPNMRLGHLVTEISALAGATDPATESQVRNMFTTIVNPDSSAFKALRSNLALALTAHLLLGKAAAAADGPLANPLGAVLARAGAGVLAGDVAELAGRLARVAGVVEGVFPEVLQVLAASSSSA